MALGEDTLAYTGVSHMRETIFSNHTEMKTCHQTLLTNGSCVTLAWYSPSSIKEKKPWRRNWVRGGICLFMPADLDVETA